ncbi:hypothetical protein H5J22_07535 [Cetobacterium sp. 8H]|uniref:hypothetical protein n=1 Tax=Cetobacterium sp. 8H TaxID=2759681 RepID=UPI00163CF7FA|nr:hypothetical protein [Cetobacterium sp. 8H]MBC2851258.1 hypothetical protein [Cetobacterium sp. 8H]
MKIAIVGYPDSVEKILRTLSSQYSGVTFLSYEINQLGEPLDHLNELRGKVDGIYSTGIGVYSEIVNQLELDIPIVYSNREVGGILKALWKVRDDYSDLSMLKIGADIVKEKTLNQVLEEFGIKLESVTVQEYLENKKESDFLDEHIKNLAQNKVNCILTSFGYVYDYFKGKNIPVYRLQASRNEIINQMDNLLKDIQIHENNKNRIGIKIIKIVKRTKKDENFYDKGMFKVKLNQLFLKYSKIIHGSYQELGDDEYAFFTTQRILEKNDNHDFFYKILNQVVIPSDKLAIGIGYAENIQEASKNARKALEISLINGKGEAYLFSDNKIRGPLYKKNRLDYMTKVSDNLKKEAKEIGVSPKYLSKIKAIQESLGKREFTSKELSEMLEISERSVNRVIKPILDNGFATTIEYEVCSKVGRPRRVIRFNF